jgi:hypothetical protein
MPCHKSSVGRRVAATVAVLTVISFGARSVHAWNDRGHMVVAYIAFKHLTAPAKKEVGRLLKLNPQYSSWIAGLPASASEDQRTLVALISAATWPDFIKGQSEYIADGTDNGNTPPPGPSASQNIGYSDKNMHKYWHFVDMPFTDDGTPTIGPQTVNALTQIELLRSALASPSASDEVKSYDLSWLAHLVGDVHQPLHAIARFTAHDTDGDNGGNDVNHLHCAAGVDCPANLHALWDGVLGIITTGASISALGSTLNNGPAPGGADATDVAGWIQESVAVAKAKVYKNPAGGRLGDPSAVISKDYVASAKTAARKRVLLGGYRLAALINQALGH